MTFRILYGQHTDVPSQSCHDLSNPEGNGVILEHIFLIITDTSYALKEGDALICRRQLNEQTGHGAHSPMEVHLHSDVNLMLWNKKQTTDGFQKMYIELYDRQRNTLSVKQIPNTVFRQGQML
jgi:hypothetical protein